MALFENYERRADKILGVIKEYGISSIPCLIAFKGGRETNRSVGLVGREAVEKLL